MKSQITEGNICKYINCCNPAHLVVIEYQIFLLDLFVGMQWITSWHFVVMKRHFTCLNIWSVTFSCEIYYLLERATCLSLLRNSWNYHKPCHVMCFALSRIKLVELNSSSCKSLDFTGVTSEIIHLRLFFLFYFIIYQF